MMTMTQMERKLQKAGRRQAVLYLFCNFISLMLITAYAAMMFSNTVQTIFPENGDSRKQMMAIFVLTLFGCMVFTVYASSLFFRKKSRQMGILLALGASRKQLSLGLLQETFWLSSISSLAGMAAGFPFVILLWNGFRLLVVDSSEMALSLNPACLLIAIPFFLLVVAFSCITAVRCLKRTNILDVIQEEHKNEPVKELGKWCGPAGILLIFAGAAAGYYAPVIYMNALNKMAPLWTNFFYLPVFIGLYMLILHVVVHGVIPHRKNPYKNLISRSMMKFQGKQTVNSLLVCTVLMAGGVFGIFYLPMMASGQLTSLRNQTYDYSFPYRSDQTLPDQKQIQEMASRYDLTVEDYHEDGYALLALDSEAEVMDTEDSWHYEYQRINCQGRFLSETAFRKLTGKSVDIHPGQSKAINRTDGSGSYEIRTESKVITNMVTRQELATSFSGYVPYDVLSTTIPFYLLDDSDYEKITQGLTPEWKEVMVCFNIQGEDSYAFARELFLAIVDASGPECELPSYYDRVEKIVDEEKGEPYWGDSDSMTKISYDSPDSSDFRSYWTYMPKFRILDQNDFLKTFAVFLMMFLFISIVCILATLIICYTRCQTIALNNRYVFDDLRRLGGSPKFLASEVRAQCSRVFFLPSVIGMIAMYLLYISIMYVNDGTGISSTELLGLLLCAGILLLIAIFVYLVYRMTVKKICRQLAISV